MTEDRRKSIPTEPGSQLQLVNEGRSGLGITIAMPDGTRIDIELVPGQTVSLVVGKTGPQITLRDGDPGGLRLIE